MPSQINASNSGFGGIVSTGDSSGVLQLQTTGTTAVTIDASQNVGIGTTSPSSKLTVASSNVTVNAGYGIAFTGDQDRIMTPEDNVSGALIKWSSGGICRFSAAATERMRIDSSGNVGIGTSSANTKLNLSASTSAGTVAATPSIVLSNRNNTNSTFNAAVIAVDTHRDVANPHYSGAIWFTRIPASSNNSSASDIIFGTGTDVTQGSLPTERMRITSGGLILFNTTSSLTDSAQFQTVVSTGKYARGTKVTTNGDYAEVMYNATGGSVGSIQINSGGTVFATTSDYRLKENIAPMIGALDKVALLKPVTYKWKADGSNAQGFIAHELQEIFPDAVTGKKDDINEDGSIKPQGIDTSALVATLTAAIQEQQTIINDLKARIETLEAK